MGKKFLVFSVEIPNAIGSLAKVFQTGKLRIGKLAVPTVNVYNSNIPTLCFNLDKLMR